MEHTKKIYIKTFGCRLNISESESLAYQLIKKYTIVEKHDNADVLIVNTCSVTESAENKFKKYISPLLKKNKKIIVTGCYFDTNNSLFHHPNVVFIEKQFLFAEIELILNSKCDSANYHHDNFNNVMLFPHPSLDKIIHSRAFLKIQDGCDNVCTYCNVRLVRGSAVSLPYGEVLERFQHIIKSCFQEVILTGINIASYKSNDKSLSHLLSDMISLIPSDKTIWIQLSSLEAQNIDTFFYTVIQNPVIKPYFHIPLQSGSQTILKAMNRHYTADSYRDIIKKIKFIRNDAYFSTDVIVGFPGETDKDFEDTYSVCKDIGYHHLHIFPYSKRNQTAAALYPHKIEPSLIKNRLSVLKKLSETNKTNFYQSFLDKEEFFVVTKKAFNMLEGKSYHSLDIEYTGMNSEKMNKGFIYKGKIKSIGNFKAQLW